MNKTAAERSIEALTWAAIVIWLGFALVAHILNYVWLVVMMLGIILLSSAIYQRSRGWHTSLSLWIFGIWMAVFSVIETVSTLVSGITGGEGLGIDLWVYLGIALVSMGIAVVFRTVQGPALAGERGVPSRLQADSDYAGSTRRFAAPRRVEEDNSLGYVPSPQERAQYEDYGTAGRTVRARASARTGRTGRYDAALPDDSQYTQRSARAPREDAQYTQPSPGARRSTSSSADRAGARSTSPRQRRTRATPEPNDLDARVDDIIRRSRERRGGASAPPSGDDLPY